MWYESDQDDNLVYDCDYDQDYSYNLDFGFDFDHDNNSDEQNECRFGTKCKYLSENRCFNFHPTWHKQAIQKQQENKSNTRPCKYGDNCRFFRQSRCWFYHPPRNQNSRLSKQVKKDNSFQAFFRRQQQLRKEKEERERRQRQLQLAKLQQIERERERQRERLALMRARLQQMRPARSQQKIKLNSEEFDWYFSKNNTFKGCEISEEKLQHLEHCIICFISFIDNPEEQEVKPEQKIEPKKMESKEYLEKELTELYCKHTFHKDCIKKWLQTNPGCPVCRKNFQEHEEYNKWEEEKKQMTGKKEKQSEVAQMVEARQLRPSLQRSSYIEELLRRLSFM